MNTCPRQDFEMTQSHLLCRLLTSATKRFSFLHLWSCSPFSPTFFHTLVFLFFFFSNLSPILASLYSYLVGINPMNFVDGSKTNLQ